MSYKTLEHATDAIIEVTADNLKEAFEIAGISVIDTILDSSKVEENDSKKLIVKGKDLKYLLHNWSFFQALQNIFLVQQYLPFQLYKIDAA